MKTVLTLLQVLFDEALNEILGVLEGLRHPKKATKIVRIWKVFFLGNELVKKLRVWNNEIYDLSSF